MPILSEAWWWRLPLAIIGVGLALRVAASWRRVLASNDEDGLLVAHRVVAIWGTLAFLIFLYWRWGWIAPSS